MGRVRVWCCDEGAGGMVVVTRVFQDESVIDCTGYSTQGILKLLEVWVDSSGATERQRAPTSELGIGVLAVSILFGAGARDRVLPVAERSQGRQSTRACMVIIR